jgi:hypothetical protein
MGDHKEEHKAHSEHHHHAGHKGAVVHVHAKAKGGKVMEDERTKEMVDEEDRGEKRGGGVKGMKPKARADRRARGGRMTPKSPMTGAGNMHGPGTSYESRLGHIDEGGKGRETRP